MYLMRHGETVWNTEGRLQGQRDSPLTTRGFLQAQEFGSILSREITDLSGYRVISSPLPRAWQTAVVVADALGMNPAAVETDARLREISFGHWEGMTRDEICEVDREAWTHRCENRWFARVRDGECYADVTERVEDWLSKHLSEDRLIVVSHGVTSRIIRGLYARMDHDDILALDEPQDRVFRLSDGLVDELQ